MADPNRPLHSAQFFNNNVPTHRAVKVTEKFIDVAIVMLRTLKRGDVDRLLVQQSSKDLINVILWLVSDAFRGVAELCNWGLQGAQAKRLFMNKINQLGQIAQAMANQAGYVPLIPHRSNIWSGWRAGNPGIPNIAAQAPLELLFQTILRVRNPATHANAIAALNNAFFRQAGRVRWANIGIAKCVFLCQGQAVRPPTANNRWIAPMSDSKWGAFTDLDQWAKDARQNSRMTDIYRTQLTSLTNRLARDVRPLGVAYRNGLYAGADGRLQAEWTRIAALPPALGPPITYNHLNDRAMSYAIPEMTPRTRCRRCRVIFRYSCVAEPDNYTEQIYPTFSCAEAVAHPMCVATSHG